ncbi:MAG TPA: 16S rRNA (guanine(527)-N(7))-methyltransferase RsmG [Ruminiclostridium sp.]|nr:16S rRNA (guanine(527)-N(7))-methyltransferase RsmG [Ruminiclostridium sp.]
MSILSDKLLSGAQALKITLGDDAVDKFEKFTAELLNWNKVMNLTAITEPSDIALKHYIDSIAMLKYAEIKPNASVADVGCGAGFPGIPIKIARPDILLCCIDSLAKRVNFLDEVTRKLEFKDTKCIHARAEEIGKKVEFREKFDFSFARAVAKLRVLAEYCLPLVKVGGAFIAMKAGGAEEEINEAKSAVKAVGGKIENVVEYTLPDTDISRTIIIIRKIDTTPEKYPRASAKISKSPL